MKPRGLLSKRRDDNTFYAYINEEVTRNLFKNRGSKFYSDSLQKVTPSHNAHIIRKNQNRVYSNIERKTQEEHERRNKAKIMLQSVILNKVKKPENSTDNNYKSFVTGFNKNKGQIAMLGKLPDYSHDFNDKVSEAKFMFPNTVAF